MTIAAAAARRSLLISALGALAACESGGTSTAEAERAAEQQVRERFALPADAQFDTDVFVGTPLDGEIILCGTVRSAGGGNAFPPQRFVAKTDPATFLKFQAADAPTPPTAPNMFVEWDEHCAGNQGENSDEPLAPTEAGEER